MTDEDSLLLANPVWEAINGPQRAFGDVHGQAAVYDMHVSPFGGVQELTSAAINDLAQLCDSGRVVALMYRDGRLPDLIDWDLIEAIEVLQMVHSGKHTSLPLESTHLTTGHVGQMIDLVKLTNPGPFGKRTIELGNYYGIVESSRLLAMAGERFKPPGWVEVSGVCTHPSSLGRGYAGGLASTLVSQIHDSGLEAFLNVRIGSPSEEQATRVYEKLGFERYRTMQIAVLQKR
jgi:ribosomal protein S18 acetylase RimI-like enzyme